MTMKRVFLTLLAALLLPGLAMAQTTTRATFTVQKYFDDGNSATDVTVNIQCFTGVPLNQSQTVNPDNNGEFEVEFVVESFNNEELDCDVWEDPIAGYSADYEIGYNNAGDYSDSDNGADACEFEDVASGGSEEDQNLCTITNFPDPVTVTINKEWVIEGSGGNALDPHYKLSLYCEDRIIDGYEKNNGDWKVKFHGVGTSGETYTAAVIPDWDGGTSCWVDERVYDSSVEVDNDCGELEVEIGAGDSCTITNTVFYEGIPTLSQYGMAILALLMLGVGFVGFRRFV